MCDAWAKLVGLGAQHRCRGNGHQGIRVGQSSWRQWDLESIGPLWCGIRVGQDLGAQGSAIMRQESVLAIFEWWRTCGLRKPLESLEHFALRRAVAPADWERASKYLNRIRTWSIGANDLPSPSVFEALQVSFPADCFCPNVHDLRLVVGKFGSDFRFELEPNRTEHEVQVQGSANP
ncbi:hypothetical protein C8J57DRAFT_1242295 [Mycena rebaudengoi]|nr:hypothetical protein C8J57DRAFT_1242295 [Mycena rebaudengoi]